MPSPADIAMSKLPRGTNVATQVLSGGSGVINWLRGVFSMTSKDTFNISGYLEEVSETRRVQIAQKLYDFYQGDCYEIEQWLQGALSKTFTAQDRQEFQLLYMPILRRIIDKVCLVYKGKTERNLSNDATTQKYAEILVDSDIDQKAKHWHKMGRLFHTVLVQPVVREDDKGKRCLNFDVWTPNKIMVVEKEDNFQEPDKVVYSIQARLPDGTTEIRNVCWSDTEHYVTDHTGAIIKDETNPDNINPYGTLPFAVLRMKETENFWGEGETVLANIEEKIDVLLVQLMDLLIMQGHGQAVLTNAKIEGDLQTGPKHPLLLNAQNPDIPATMEFLSVNGKVKEITDAIDWIINQTLVMYGLSQSSTQGKSQVASGYAKLIDNWDILEMREEDVAILKVFERELFEKVKAVISVEGLYTFSDSEQLNAEFDDYKFPEDPVIDMEVKKMKLDLGLWSPVDDLMAEDDTLSEDDALQEIEDNLTVRNRLNDQFGLTLPLSAKSGQPGGQLAKPGQPGGPPLEDKMPMIPRTATGDLNAP